MSLVVLGRDGVINAVTGEGMVTDPEAWQALPGSLRAIARLCHAHYRVVVVTNQPGLATGRLDPGMLQRIHHKMLREVAAEGGHIEAVLYCPHAPGAGCDCRKPRAGLLRELGERLGLSLQDVPVIGDDRADVEMARAVGARPVLVRTGRGEATLAAAGGGLEDVSVAADLAAAVDGLLDGRLETGS